MPKTRRWEKVGSIIALAYVSLILVASVSFAVLLSHRSRPASARTGNLVLGISKMHLFQALESLKSSALRLNAIDA